MDEKLQAEEKKFIRDHMAQTPMIGEASRMSASAALEDTIKRLRFEADQLEALLNYLPRMLPHSADEAMWKLVMHYNR